MREIPKAFLDAKTAASYGCEVTRPDGALNRIAARLGRIAGTSDYRQTAAEEAALVKLMLRRYEDALGAAQGVTRDVAETIVALKEGKSSGKTPEWSSQEEYRGGRVVNRWHAHAVATGNAAFYKSSASRSRMLTPPTFSFAGVDIPVDVISLHLSKEQDKGSTALIFINPNTQETLPDPFSRQRGLEAMGQKPQVVFGKKFRIDVDEAGHIGLMRSNNLITGFTDANRVSFESQHEASEAVASLLQQTREHVQEQAAFDTLAASVGL